MSRIDDILEQKRDAAFARENSVSIADIASTYLPNTLTKPGGLTEKARLAADAYLETGNIKAAGEAAGYMSPAVSGNHAISSQNVQRYISQQIDASANRVGVNLDWKMNMLKLIATRCVSDDMSVEMTASLANAAIHAISELNKMQGHYAPQIAINHNTNINETVDKVRAEIKRHVQVYDVEAQEN